MNSDKSVFIRVMDSTLLTTTSCAQRLEHEQEKACAFVIARFPFLNS